MALSYLKYDGSISGSHEFYGDIGSNKYYQFLVGPAKGIVKRHGMSVITGASYTSELEQKPEGLMRSFSFELPDSIITDDENYVQLISFRTSDRMGPALSEIVRVPVTLTDISNYSIMESISQLSIAASKRNKYPLHYREMTTEQMSFNWMQLVNMIPGILEQAAPIVNNAAPILNTLLGILTPRLGQTVPTAGATPLVNPPPGATPSSGIPANSAVTPEMIQQLIQAINQASNRTVGTNATNAIPAATPPVSASSLQSLQMDYGVISGPVLAGIVSAVGPALLQQLPKLLETAAPAMQQLLTPETIQALGDPAQMNQLLTHLMNTFQQADQARLQSMDSNRQNRLNFFRQANPTIQQYLQGRPSTASFSGSTKKAAQINFVEGSPVTLLGKPRIVYRASAGIRFPFEIESQGDYPQAIVQIRVIGTESNNPLLEKKFRLKDIASGQVIYDLQLTPEEAYDLPSHEDLLLDTMVKLKDEKGKLHRTRKIHRFRLAPSYLFDRVQKKTDIEIPLNDVVQYRDFWHKVWEQDLRSDVRRYYLEGKYYTLLEAENEEGAIMETRLNRDKDQERGHRRYLRFKSGMKFSLYQLNNLISQITSQSSVTPELLEAIQTPEVVRHFQKAARVEAEFKGRPDETVTLWGYPVLAMHEIVLKRPEEADANGQVISFSEEIVAFPIPVAMHFVGVKSEVS